MSNSKAKAKTINLLLNEGSLKGVICMEDSAWNRGELYSAPRESVEDLMSSEACAKYGVYLLLSEDMQAKYGTGTITKKNGKWVWVGYYKDDTGKIKRPTKTFKIEKEAIETLQSQISRYQRKLNELKSN